MSLFKRDSALVAVERENISLTRCGRDISDSSGEYRIDLNVSGKVSDALASLHEPLSKAPWRNMRREAVVSDRLVHYLVLERPQGARSLNEIRLAVESRFAQTFAAAAPDWIFQIALRPFAQYFVACAMPRDLVDALQSLLSETGNCASIRPYLLFSLNRNAKRIPDDCWYAAVSENCVSIAQVRSGDCRRIRVLPGANPKGLSLLDLVERERTMVGEEGRSAPICVAGLTDEPETSNVLLFDQGKPFSDPFAPRPEMQE